MRRVAVIGMDENARRQLAARLRHAAVVDAHDADACVCIADTSLATVQSFLNSEKPVLIAADFCLADERFATFLHSSPDDGGPLIVNPDHFLPSRLLLRQHLDAGKLGELGLLRLHRWQPHDARPASIGDLPVPLIMDVELTLWFAGWMPELVFALERADEAESTSTFLQLHFGFSGGAMALLDYARRMPAGDGYDSLSLIGSSGAAYADDHQNMQLAYRGGRASALRTDERAGQLAAMVQHFVDSLAEGHKAAELRGRSWSEVLRVADAVRGSLASGESVLLENS